MLEKYKRCPNCGRKGLYLTDNCLLENKKAKCKYCEMEFEPVIRNGERVMQGDVPSFVFVEEEAL